MSRCLCNQMTPSVPSLLYSHISQFRNHIIASFTQVSQSEHQPAPSSSVYQYLLSCPWPLVLGTQSSASDICINLTPPKFAGIWPVFTATLLSPFPSLITFTAWREVGIKPCLAGIDPEYVPFLTFSSRRMGQNQLFENIKYSVTT